MIEHNIEWADGIDVLGVLLGQMDGRVFIPRQAVEALRRDFEVVSWEDEQRLGWHVELRKCAPSGPETEVVGA